MAGIAGLKPYKEDAVRRVNKRAKRRCVGVLLLSVALTHPSLGTAQVLGTGVMPVTEVGPNLVQNTLQAVRSLISNANEVMAIQNQITSLANEARQLASLPLTVVNEIDQAISGYTQLLNAGQGIAYQVKASVDQFEALYAQGFGGNGSFMDRAKRMIDQVRAAGRLATQASAIFERLCVQQTRVTQLMAASNASIGSLQAQQAGNQLMGVLAEQQVSMQQLLATNQRLKISETMQQLVLQDQAYTDAQRFFGTMQPVPFRGPGEGQGFRLTD
jgi:type IV secretion system protein TrbJ